MSGSGAPFARRGGAARAGYGSKRKAIPFVSAAVQLRVSLALAITALSSPALAQPSPAPEGEADRLRCVQLAQLARYDDAFDAASTCIAHAPQSAECYFLRAGVAKRLLGGQAEKASFATEPLRKAADYTAIIQRLHGAESDLRKYQELSPNGADASGELQRFAAAAAAATGAQARAAARERESRRQLEASTWLVRFARPADSSWVVVEGGSKMCTLPCEGRLGPSERVSLDRLGEDHESIPMGPIPFPTGLIIRARPVPRHINWVVPTLGTLWLGASIAGTAGVLTACNLRAPVGHDGCNGLSVVALPIAALSAVLAGTFLLAASWHTAGTVDLESEAGGKQDGQGSPYVISF